MTLGELINYWNELSAISLYDHSVMQRTRSPSRVVYPRRKFVSHMAREAGISQQAADEITAKLTMNRHENSTQDRVAEHNPQLRPFVQVEGGLFLATTLTVPSMGQQRTTKMLQVAYSGSLSGNLRQQLGDEGEKRVFDLLKGKLRSDVLIAKNVLVHRGNTGSRPATDLDVVVYAPRRGAGDHPSQVAHFGEQPIRSPIPSGTGEDGPPRLGGASRPRWIRGLSRCNGRPNGAMSTPIGANGNGSC